ncbi:MAG: ferredoxin [Spirochaetaceae bacterium]|jgi:ferredoxin/flavodoxin|nr:ferredoxin [Spirochaetaceae bacterium]
MKITKVWAVYFSGTGTTKKLVEALADTAAVELGAPSAVHDFSLPEARERFPVFQADHLVFFGTPVYAGRVPNLLLKPLAAVRGGNAAAVPVALFGNRAYDDALIELRDILAACGFRPFAAGAFVGEHSFSTTLGRGRPDGADMALAQDFARKAARKIAAAESPGLITVKGTPAPYRGYYQPRDRQGNPIDIRKVKPETSDGCTNCKVCAEICTMGSINRDNVRDIPGICIKCCACVKGCPRGAKFFSDKNFLYHQHELEAQFSRRAEPEVFL